MDEACDKPLLSICIPTRNRQEMLGRCLSTLTGLETFSRSQDVEIVISDNASSDATEKVCLEFVSRWPGRIRYFRNTDNVGDENFFLALRRGRGEFLKLSNDTLLFSEEGLACIFDAVKRNMKRRPLLFFTNGNGTSGAEAKECDSIDGFVSAVSFYTTWIGSVGFWKEQLTAMPDFARMCSSQLTQVDAIFRILSMSAQSVVYNRVFAKVIPVKNKGGYSLSRVFGSNYFSILRHYVKTGSLSSTVYRREKRRVLRRHLLPYYIKTNSDFLGFGYVRDLLPHFFLDPVYYAAMPFVYVQSVYKLLRLKLRKGRK